MSRRALFVCYGGGHAKMVIPIVHAIRANPGLDLEPLVLAATTAGPQVARAGIAAYGYRDLLEDRDTEALSFGRSLLAGSHDPRSGISEEESIAYLGLSYADLVERLGPAEAADRFAQYGRHAFLQLGPLRRALDRFDPAVVITTNSPKSERAAMIAAEERGLPAVYIEDLLGALPAAHPPFVPAPHATRYCVGSQIAADALVGRLGVDRAAIRLTGNPAFDRLAHIDPSTAIEVRRVIGLRSDGGPVVVYMDPGGTPPAAVGQMAMAVLKCTGIKLVVRRHPNARHVAPDEFIRLAGGEILLADDVDLDGLLVASDVIVTVASTTAVEAVLVGRPVIQLGTATGVPAATHDNADELPLYRYGVAVLIDSLNSLADLIPQVLDTAGHELQERAADLFVKPGTAASAIATEISALAAGSSAPV